LVLLRTIHDEPIELVEPPLPTTYTPAAEPVGTTVTDLAEAPMALNTKSFTVVNAPCPPVCLRTIQCAVDVFPFRAEYDPTAKTLPAESTATSW
jgi:hypothetical protein